MDQKAFQDYYAEDYSYCYGCGRLNEHGLQIKSYWEGEETVAVYKPLAQHIAIPGFVYGGLIASLIDCHSTGTAAAAAYKREGREMDTQPQLRFLTASLQVDYLLPTPLGVALEVRGTIEEIKERKVVVSTRLIANGDVCATGKVIAVKIPDNFPAKS